MLAVSPNFHLYEAGGRKEQRYKGTFEYARYLDTSKTNRAAIV